MFGQSVKRKGIEGREEIRVMRYRNPIISGHNPDPSICRVGEDYYIVNSSFEFFPGVPIYHSRNLVNWELIGYCLTRKNQFDISHTKSSGGVFAPTLYHHDGTFYMITTNIDKGNFIVYTEDIRGEWSDPVWIDQKGIDPSLLFDEDGTVYFLSADNDKGDAAILLCTINLRTGEKLTDTKIISHGCGGRYPEGPHLYKLFGKYYLMLAEGGTEYGHMETMQRAESPYGPYEQCPHNPILTHRNDMRGEIYCTGHADIVEDTNGNWWMVCLATRPCGDKFGRVMLHNLGRETFLTPIIWDADGWPVVGEKGLISLEMEGELPGHEIAEINRDFYDDYHKNTWNLHYNFLRTPEMENYVIDEKKKELTMKGTQVTLNDVGSPTWIGIKQQGFDTVSTVKVKTPSQEEGMRIGITAFYNESYHYEMYITKEKGKRKICLAKYVHDIFAVTGEMLLPDEAEEVTLRLESDKVNYTFFYRFKGKEFIKLGQGLTIGLATEGTKTMTFTGTYIALFAEKGVGIFKDFSVKVLDY